VGTYYTVTIVAAKAFLGDIWSTNSPPNSKGAAGGALWSAREEFVRPNAGFLPDTRFGG